MRSLAALGLLVPLLAQAPAITPDESTGRRLLARADVAAAVESLKAREPSTIDDQVALSQIPAPPFKESTRAEAVRQRFAAAGLTDVRVDRAGNVLGTRRARARESGWRCRTRRSCGRRGR